MKIALLGATGFVGSALLKEALDRGHMVTAIVRHPEKLEKREGLTAKAGDIYDTTYLATLIQGNDAVISAFNPGWKNPNLYDDQVPGHHCRHHKCADQARSVGGRGGRAGSQARSSRHRQPRHADLGKARFSGDH